MEARIQFTRDCFSQTSAHLEVRNGLKKILVLLALFQLLHSQAINSNIVNDAPRHVDFPEAS